MGNKVSIRKSDPTRGKKQESGKDGELETWSHVNVFYLLSFSYAVPTSIRYNLTAACNIYSSMTTLKKLILSAMCISNYLKYSLVIKCLLILKFYSAVVGKESSSEQGFNIDNSRASKGFKPGAPALGGRKRGSESIQLEGKNTFAVPRSVKPIEKNVGASKPAEDDETPKSNDEFRKLLLKK